MKWLTSEVEFPSLQTLVLGLMEPQADLYMTQGVDIDEESIEFMRLFVHLSERLPPLRSTRIYGDCGYESYCRFLKSHAATVQKLAFFAGPLMMPRSDSGPDITDRQWGCTALKDLSIPMARTGGDANEVRLYRWVGANGPNLRNLFLSVDCSGPGVSIDEDSPSKSINNPAIYRSRDGRLSNMRNVLRNYAIDKTPVESIFCTVSAAKLPGSPALQRLELKILPDNAGDYPEDMLRLCVTELGRNRVCGMRYRDGQQSQLVFEESPIFDREDESDGEASIGDHVIAIFRALWPEKFGESRTEGWHSFPLDL